MKCYENDGGFFEPVPGKYRVALDKARESEFKSGKPAWQLDLRIVEGGAGVGETTSQRVPAFMISRMGKMLGLQRKTDGDGRGYYDVGVPDLEGREFSVEFESREYNGRTFCGIKTMDLAPARASRPKAQVVNPPTPVAQRDADETVPF